MLFVMFRKIMLQGLESLQLSPIVPDFPEQPELDEHNPLLDLIFSKDERGCFTGDLAKYLSPKTNSEVRQFINEQLMSPSSDGKGLSLPPDVLNRLRGVISDDDIAKFSRNHGESPEQYAMRIGTFFSEEKAKNVAKAKFEREKKRLEDLGFKFD